jgi:Family of unknown function (DUF6069)
MGNQGAQFQPKRVALAALAGGAAAATANIGVFLISLALGVDFIIQPDPSAPAGTITVPSLVGASLLPALLAGGLLMLLGRFTTKARRTFVLIASAVALLSLGGPATVGGASAGTRMALMVMHLLAAAVISGVLLRSESPKENQP